MSAFTFFVFCWVLMRLRRVMQHRWWTNEHVIESNEALEMFSTRYYCLLGIFSVTLKKMRCVREKGENEWRVYEWTNIYRHGRPDNLIRIVTVSGQFHWRPILFTIRQADMKSRNWLYHEHFQHAGLLILFRLLQMPWKFY